MNIYINGHFLLSDECEVKKFAFGFLFNLDKLIKNNTEISSRYHFILLAPSGVRGSVPSYSSIDVVKIGESSGDLWEQLELPFASRNGALICLEGSAPLLSRIINRSVYVACPNVKRTVTQVGAKSIFYSSAIASAKKIFALTVEDKEILSKKFSYNKDNIEIIPCGGSLADRKTSIINMNKENPYLLYIPPKNGNNFKTNMSLIQTLKSCRISMKIIADMPKSMIPANAPIELISPIENCADLSRIYSGAICLLYNVNPEMSCPIIPIEAMSCNCPVIASDIPSLHRHLGEGALYCDPGDIVDISKKIVRILESDEFRQETIQKGKIHASLYSWDRPVAAVMRKILDIELQNSIEAESDETNGSEEEPYCPMQSSMAASE